jgi:hypothetical protein
VHSRAGAVLPISRIRKDGREWCCASTAFRTERLPLDEEMRVARGFGMR